MERFINEDEVVCRRGLGAHSEVLHLRADGCVLDQRGGSCTVTAQSVCGVITA